MSTRQAMGDTPSESARIGPDDPRYLAVVEKRFNKRFRASPDYVRLVSSTEQVVAAVEDAVSEGRRLVVTSGGHCHCFALTRGRGQESDLGSGVLSRSVRGKRRRASPRPGIRRSL